MDRGYNRLIYSQLQAEFNDGLVQLEIDECIELVCLKIIIANEGKMIDNKKLNYKYLSEFIPKWFRDSKIIGKKDWIIHVKKTLPELVFNSSWMKRNIEEKYAQHLRLLQLRFMKQFIKSVYFGLSIFVVDIIYLDKNGKVKSNIVGSCILKINKNVIMIVSMDHSIIYNEYLVEDIEHVEYVTINTVRTIKLQMRQDNIAILSDEYQTITNLIASFHSNLSSYYNLI